MDVDALVRLYLAVVVIVEGNAGRKFHPVATIPLTALCSNQHRQSCSSGPNFWVVS
jgi:hypothetical protein